MKPVKFLTILHVKGSKQELKIFSVKETNEAKDQFSHCTQPWTTKEYSVWDSLQAAN